MTASDLAAKLHAKKTGDGWSCRCPSHDDKNASLTITEGDDGRVLTHCFAGCTFPEIVTAMGLNPGDLFPDKDHHPHHSGHKARPTKPSRTWPDINAAATACAPDHGEVETVRVYRDATGAEVAAVVRYRIPDDKTFRQFVVTAEGWAAGGLHEKWPLLDLPDVLSHNGVVHIVEGEKCTDALRTTGLFASCAAGGANAADKTDWTPLAGREVHLLPDNDEPGRKFAQRVMEILSELDPPAQVSWVELPGLTDLGVGADVADWLDARDAHGPEELAATIMEAAVVEIAEAPGFVSLGSLPDPSPEDENPAALFKNGWLRKGGGALLVAPSGVGKSVASIHQAASWTMGLGWFGITPVRPLHIGIIQTEDDAEEMAFFRNEITEGLVEEGHDRVKVREAFNNIRLFDATGCVGETFLQKLKSVLRANPELDLVMVNPLQAFFGGDLSRNSELSAFFRAGLDPVIKPSRCGILFTHHCNKPPASKDRNGWGTDAFSAYIGSGGAELVNWARAVLALMPVEGSSGVFRLVAGKRGQRLGWTDANGVKTTQKLIAHHDRLVYWREADASALPAVEDRRGSPEADAGALVDRVKAVASKLGDVRTYAVDTFGAGRGRRAFDHFKNHIYDHGLVLVHAKRLNASFVGLRMGAEQAAREYDHG